MTPPERGSEHRTTAYYSFIYLEWIKGWVGLLGWPYSIADGLPKWSPIIYRSSVGQGKFAGHRPTFYHCATQPTKEPCIWWGPDRLRWRGNFVGRLAHWKALRVTAMVNAAKKSITALVWLLQPTVFLPTGWCHINFPPWKIRPPAMRPLVKILWPLFYYCCHWRMLCIL